MQLRVTNSLNRGLEAYLNATCVYKSCTNEAAVSLNDLPQGGLVHSYDLGYLIESGKAKWLLGNSIRCICHETTSKTVIESATVTHRNLTTVDIRGDIAAQLYDNGL